MATATGSAAWERRMAAGPSHREIRVECYAGGRADETPRRVFVDDRTVDVMEIVDRWLAPDHRYFKFAGDDGCVYIIRHDVSGERWELTWRSD
jgi:hypothetical protein